MRFLFFFATDTKYTLLPVTKTDDFFNYVIKNKYFTLIFIVHLQNKLV